MSGLGNFRPTVTHSPVSLGETFYNILFLGTVNRMTIRRGKAFIWRKPKLVHTEGTSVKI